MIKSKIVNFAHIIEILYYSMIAISIVVHRTPVEQLRTILNCVSVSQVKKHIFVVDNSPADSLRTIVKEYQGVEYLFVENRGYGASHNSAICKSIANGCEYHLVVNPDVKWTGDVVYEMKKFMDSHPKCGLSCASTYYPDGKLQRVCRLLPSPLDLMLRCLPGGRSTRRNNRYELDFTGYDKIMNVPYIMGSFMFFRIEALKNVGLFDERFFMYPEDIDITRRVRERYQVLFNPFVSIVHNHAAQSRKNLKMFWIHATNMIKYFNKWGWFKDSLRSEFNKRLLSTQSPDIWASEDNL